MKNPLLGRTYTKTQLEKILHSLNLDPKTVLPKSVYPEVFLNDHKFERFSHVKLKLIPAGRNDIKIRISGNYVSSYMAGYQDTGGNWYPSKETKVPFKYEGKL
ncbi:hypothetical protein JXB28_05070 [Candidatus Woesearchaeota archaeon]|nr:hypothetical protein [Candidatus Woesearchaeota archaeon]